MKKQIKYILTGAMLALSVAGIAACKSGEELSAPSNLQVSEYDILTWDEVKGATSYLVTIDEEEYETETNSLDIFLLTNKPKTYEIKVAAYGSDHGFTEWSESVEYTVPLPPLKLNLTDDGTGYRLMPSGQMLIADYSGKPLIKYDGKAYGVGKVSVPSMYNGKPVKEIAAAAFSECEGLTGLILPDTVEEIGNQAFYECVNLKRIGLPAYVETIQSDTFYQCESLKEIELPDGLRKIDNGAFCGCMSLETIEIPSAVEQIKSNIFAMCHNLTQVTVDAYNEDFWSEGNCIIRESDGALIVGCNASVIPQGVTSIEENAFCNCSELKELKIPASVTKIKDNAFANCYALEKVELSNGLKELNGSSIFRDCKNLKSLNIPRTVELINNRGWGLFNGAGLLSLTVDEENPYYFSDGNCIIRKTDGVLVAGCDSSVIPDYVEEIGKCAFYGCKIENLSLPAGLKTIGYGAFQGCPLTNLYIPESVETIGGAAFNGCGLQSVVLPGSVKTIGICAFKGARNIYTSAEKANEGWAAYSPSEIWYSGKVWYGSAQKDENGLLYVNSITVKKSSSGGTSGTPSYDPYREGYIFKGWTTEEGGTEPLFERTLRVIEAEDEIYVYLSSEQAKTLPEGVTVLYAIWEKI